MHVFFWRTFQFLDFVARCLLPCIDPSQQVSFKVSSPCIISASLQGSSRDEARVHRECFHFEMEAQTFATLCFGNEVVTKVPFFAPLPSEASEGHQVEPGSCHMLSQSVSQIQLYWILCCYQVHVGLTLRNMMLQFPRDLLQVVPACNKALKKNGAKIFHGTKIMRSWSTIRVTLSSNQLKK